jgi:hypothetical protein
MRRAKENKKMKGGVGCKRISGFFLFLFIFIFILLLHLLLCATTGAKEGW